MKKANKRIDWHYTSLVLMTIIVVAAVIMFNPEMVSDQISGAAITVEYYGVSDKLMQTQAGKMQTRISLNQPTIKQLETEEGRLEVATKITDAMNFPKGIREIYKESSAGKMVTESTLDKIEQASQQENSNFKEQTTCLGELGEIGWQKLEINLVSELMYQNCLKKEGYSRVHVKHQYYNQLANSWYLCSQNNNPLFLINKENGQIETDVTGC